MALDYSQAKLVLDAMPWPAGARPLVQFGSEGERAMVRLYDARQKCVVTAMGPSHEGALRAALKRWMGPKPGLGLSGAALIELQRAAERLLN